eukprot:Nk52_evm1s2306 gene=Nk52_evmTU1s2306
MKGYFCLASVVMVVSILGAARCILGMESSRHYVLEERAKAAQIMADRKLKFQAVFKNSQMQDFHDADDLALTVMSTLIDFDRGETTEEFWNGWKELFRASREESQEESKQDLPGPDIKIKDPDRFMSSIAYPMDEGCEASTVEAYL